MAETTLQSGIIGTGVIATDFAAALQHSKRCGIVNVTSIPGQAEGFASNWAPFPACSRLGLP